MKIVSMRTCVITREKCEKNQLLRIVKNKDNIVFVDLSSKKDGRGAYIKKDLVVLNKAKKTKGLEKSLKIKIPDTVYEEIEKIING